MENDLYNDFENRFDSGNELNVILSLLDDRQLLKLKDGVNFMIKENVYQVPNFPLCYAGLNQIVHCIEYELASRVGKSIKIVEGGAVRCEKEESVWSNRDWREKDVEVKPVEAEMPYVEGDWGDSVTATPEKIKQETVCEPVEEGEWV